MSQDRFQGTDGASQGTKTRNSRLHLREPSTVSVMRITGEDLVTSLTRQCHRDVAACEPGQAVGWYRSRISCRFVVVMIDFFQQREVAALEHELVMMCANCFATRRAWGDSSILLSRNPTLNVWTGWSK